MPPAVNRGLRGLRTPYYLNPNHTYFFTSYVCYDVCVADGDINTTCLSVRVDFTICGHGSFYYLWPVSVVRSLLGPG